MKREWGGGGCLLTSSAFRIGAYSGWALTRGWPLIRINTVPSTDKWYPFLTPSLEQYISFNCYKCTVFKILINDKTRKCSRIFHSHKMHV